MGALELVLGPRSFELVHCFDSSRVRGSFFEEGVGVLLYAHLIQTSSRPGPGEETPRRLRVTRHDSLSSRPINGACSDQFSPQEGTPPCSARLAPVHPRVPRVRRCRGWSLHTTFLEESSFSRPAEAGACEKESALEAPCRPWPCPLKAPWMGRVAIRRGA